MNPQTDRTATLAEEQVAGPPSPLDVQGLTDVEEDRRLQRELLEAELGGEG